jgi:hypothetical protein
MKPASPPLAIWYGSLLLPPFWARIVLIVIWLLIAPEGRAATYYWTGNTNESWQSTANWSLSSGANLPHPASPPGMNDTAWFNITPEDADNGQGQTIQLSSATAVAELEVTTARDTLIQESSLMLLGRDVGGPIWDSIYMHPGSGNVTLATNVLLSTANPQRWVNASTSTLSIRPVAQPLLSAVFTLNTSLTIEGTGDTVFESDIRGNGSLSITGGNVKVGSPIDAFAGYVELNSLSVTNNGQFQITGTNLVRTRTMTLASSNNLSFTGGYLSVQDAYGNVVNDGGALLSYELFSEYPYTRFHNNYTQTFNGIWWSDNQPMTVDGAASIAGRLILISGQSIGYEQDILTAAGGVTGQFNSVISSSARNSNVALRVTYGPNSVHLKGVAASTGIQFIATTQTANWSAPTTWLTGQ